MKRYAWFLVAGLLLAAALPLAWRARHPRPSLVYLEAEPPPGWGGLSGEERAGCFVLVQEALELDPACTLLHEPPAPSASGIRRFQVSAQRTPEGGLRLVFRDGSGLLQEADGAPREALGQLLSRLGFQTGGLAALLPGDGGDFWELARLSGPFTYSQLQDRRDRALVLTRRQPGCAAAWFEAAYLQLRLLITEAARDPQAHASCEQLFEQSLARLPDYPRALHHYARYKADAGAHTEALDLAFRLRDGHPASLLGHGALAYAARNAGLLEGALRSIRAREALAASLGADPGLGENTYLYLGDLEAFERSLEGRGERPFSPLRVFYRAYVHLLRGQPGKALPLFQEAQSQPGRTIQFEALSRVYELALLGRREEALKALRELCAERVQLRVPDGEFTFKLAEAFGYLGEPAEALEMGLRAAAQGFACTRWYAQAPFLRELQGHTAWKALLRRLQDQEARLSGRYPAARFGPG